MYLSKVFLNPDRLNNAYAWHKALWTLFPKIEHGKSAPFLYRVEWMNLSKGAELLMQSEQAPEKGSDYATVLKCRTWEPQFRSGQVLAFSLRANPTKKIRDQADPERKIRVPLIKEEAQEAWLVRKMEEAGKIQEIRVQRHPPIYFRKGSRAGKIVSATFEGKLEVSQADAFQKIWASGIGPAKAFGCGMLMVQRV